MKNFAVLDKWSRITRACRLGRFDCIQNLFFFKFEIRCGYTRRFPKSFPWGNSSHVLPLTICHQNGDPLSSNQAFPHPFDYIWASKHSRHPCYVVRSKKRKKNMELREGLLTGQEGGSPCQKTNVVIFFIRHVQASQVFILTMKNKKID